MTNNQQTNPVTPVDLAAMVESRIHESLIDSEQAFDLDRARLYGVNFSGEDMQLSFVLEHGDIYQLLDTPESTCARMFDAAALVTCGWAAPIAEGADEPDSAPSVHPQRRRVRLVIVVGDSGVASVLRFRDDADNPILDGGEARGPLAEAVASYWCAP
jgi:hypothetical protein